MMYRRSKFFLIVSVFFISLLALSRPVAAESSCVYDPETKTLLSYFDISPQYLAIEKDQYQQNIENFFMALHLRENKIYSIITYHECLEAGNGTMDKSRNNQSNP